MNENNLEYLKKTLDGLGFGTKLHEVLETAVRREIPNFSLGVVNERRPLDAKDLNAPKTDHLSFVINFNRSKDSDMYFLNNYEVTLRQKDKPAAISQTFDLARDHRVTAPQAHKLLSGLSLEKEVLLRGKEDVQQGKQPEKVSVWIKLNLDLTDVYGNHPMRTFRPEYGYNLADTLNKYPIKGLDSQQKLKEAVTTLKNGNYLQAEIAIGRKTIPVSIAANPQMKALAIFDKNMVELRNETIFPEKASSKTKELQQNVSVETLSQKVAKNPEPLPWEQDAVRQEGKGRGRSK